MGILFLVLIALGVLLCLFTGIVALRSWLSFRRTRISLQIQLTEDVARLATRTGELEERLATLDARAQQLPVRISEFQENLVTLQVLTGALASSLRQAQRILSYSGLKTFSATSIASLLPNRRNGTSLHENPESAE